jgi:alkanesulfonate monooxygenase SsuD/methylene tetrahydromethanopterin reductase-like flavin-dependent oxidoreductase (luciferase family)
MRINLIVGKTHDDAWHKAEAGLAALTAPAPAPLTSGTAIRKDCAGSSRLRNHDRRSRRLLDGMVPFRSGNSTALVGSPRKLPPRLGITWRWS